MKVTFMGAGSTVFSKNVLGDTMLCEAFHDVEIALCDELFEAHEKAGYPIF